MVAMGPRIKGGDVADWLTQGAVQSYFPFNGLHTEASTQPWWTAKDDSPESKSLAGSFSVSIEHRRDRPGSHGICEHFGQMT
jgi:hypothetical protein